MNRGGTPGDDGKDDMVQKDSHDALEPGEKDRGFEDAIVVVTGVPMMTTAQQGFIDKH